MASGTLEKLALQRYLDSLEKADKEPQTNIDQSAVRAALDKLKQNPEPEAGFVWCVSKLSRRTTLRLPLTQNMR
ncbi:hypothetical protein [Tunturiibacter lichenicola]|uniref:hypothetical protein n=1 Tax=Tunturiibacter lichenicola TaxID=2051959 RepID=UPI0021B27DDC|nr:hypothetical protein [Edaphobacter lichenicola]